MAVYKVPQDVEAEDKLIGPFGFRQFIYLLIAAAAGFVAFLLAKIFIGLVLIPLPIIIFFVAIALPLRKDQPTEVYLAAILQYRFKSKRRMWKPEGQVTLVEILAPKVVEDHRIKDISEDEATSQFEQLAQIMDTRGWIGRGVPNPQVSAQNTKLNDSIVKEAADTNDMMDGRSQGAQSFDTLLSEQKKISLSEARQRMHQTTTDNADQATAQAAPASPAPPQPTALAQPQAESEADRALLAQAAAQSQPAANSRKVIQPLTQDQQPQPAPAVQPLNTPQSTSAKPPLAAIIEPVYDAGLTVATIAAEARRRQQIQANEEVVVNLH